MNGCTPRRATNKKNSASNTEAAEETDGSWRAADGGWRVRNGGWREGNHQRCDGNQRGLYQKAEKTAYIFRDAPLTGQRLDLRKAKRKRAVRHPLNNAKKQPNTHGEGTEGHRGQC